MPVNADIFQTHKIDVPLLFIILLQARAGSALSAATTYQWPHEWAEKSVLAMVISVSVLGGGHPSAAFLTSNSMLKKVSLSFFLLAAIQSTGVNADVS